MDDKLYNLIEQMRKELHEMVDREVNELHYRLKFGSPQISADITLPITTMPAYFKGKTPVSVIYPDGTEAYANTWLKVASTLLRRCVDDRDVFERLLEIRGRVFGRDRVIFAKTGDGMDRPIEFYPGMVFEGKFDTESMLKVITTRIFDPIGYDYRRIGIKVIDPMIQAAIQDKTPAQNEAEPILPAEEETLRMEM